VADGSGYEMKRVPEDVLMYAKQLAGACAGRKDGGREGADGMYMWRWDYKARVFTCADTD
jgi:hypothetical protein